MSLENMLSAQESEMKQAGIAQPSLEGSEPLNCQLETSFSEIETLQPEWDEAIVRLGAPIYMTFDWVRTWWEFYGKGKALRLFLFRQEGKVIAVVPLYLENFGAGICKAVVARLVGSNIPPKTFNPAVDAERAREVFLRVIRHLFGTDRCDLLSLGPVSAKWRGIEGVQEAARAASDLAGPPVYHPKDVQTVFSLPETFEEYLAGLSASERKSRLKRIRHLEKEHSVSVDRVSDAALVEREFDAFLEQHAKQWQAVGKGGHFVAWPRAQEFNRALLMAQARHGRVHFYRMLVDGQAVVVRYTFQLGETLFSELPARAIGEPWDKLGIGGISLLKFNQQLIEARIGEVDSGLGGYEHKANLGGGEVEVGIWRVAARRPWGAWKARGVLSLAKLMSFVFHKIWYRRLLPRMPRMFKRSQSIFWLRFDM